MGNPNARYPRRQASVSSADSVDSPKTIAVKKTRAPQPPSPDQYSVKPPHQATVEDDVTVIFQGKNADEQHRNLRGDAYSGTLEYTGHFENLEGAVKNYAIGDSYPVSGLTTTSKGDAGSGGEIRSSRLSPHASEFKPGPKIFRPRGKGKAQVHDTPTRGQGQPNGSTRTYISHDIQSDLERIHAKYGKDSSGVSQQLPSGPRLVKVYDANAPNGIDYAPAQTVASQQQVRSNQVSFAAGPIMTPQQKGYGNSHGPYLTAPYNGGGFSSQPYPSPGMSPQYGMNYGPSPPPHHRQAMQAPQPHGVHPTHPHYQYYQMGYSVGDRPQPLRRVHGLGEDDGEFGDGPIHSPGYGHSYNPSRRMGVSGNFQQTSSGHRSDIPFGHNDSKINALEATAQSGVPSHFYSARSPQKATFAPPRGPSSSRIEIGAEIIRAQSRVGAYYIPPPHSLPAINPISAPGTDNSQLLSPSALLPPRPPRTFEQRKDRAMKDIHITCTSITRNAVQITESFSPQGIPHQVVIQDFSTDPQYALASHLKIMNTAERLDFWAANFVNIEIQLKAPEEEAEGLSSLLSVVTLKPGRKSKSVAVIPYQSTVLDQLKTLPSFEQGIKHLTITLVFPSSHRSDRYCNDPTSVPAPSLDTPNIVFLTKLCDVIERCEEITDLMLNLRVPSHNRNALSMHAIYHALPFYTLKFKDWELFYQPTSMSSLLQVGGWAVTQLDREAHRIRDARKKEWEGKVRREGLGQARKGSDEDGEATF